MSRKKKKKKPSAVPPPTPNVETEERSSVALTVAWMLATFACVLAEIVWLATAAWVWSLTVEGLGPHPLSIVPDMMRLIAMCMGILSLVLFPFVLRVRQSPPPRTIVVFSIVVACLPLVATAARAIFFK